MGDSGCLGLPGRGQLLQECRAGRDFWLPAEVELAHATAGSWQECVADRQLKEGESWESWGMLVGAMSFGKGEIGKQ